MVLDDTALGVSEPFARAFRGQPKPAPELCHLLFTEWCQLLSRAAAGRTPCSPDPGRIRSFRQAAPSSHSAASAEPAAPASAPESVGPAPRTCRKAGVEVAASPAAEVVLAGSPSDLRRRT